MVLIKSNFKDDIVWIFNSQNPESLGSHRLSGLIPAEQIGIEKRIFYKTEAKLFFKKISHKKLIIFAKPFDKSVFDLIKIAKKRKIKIISTFDDWSLDANKNRIKLWTKIAKESNSVVVKTKYAKEILIKNLNINAEVIEDCLEFNLVKPLKKFSKPIKLCWFGHYSNHDTLVAGIKQIMKGDEQIILDVITNYIHQPFSSLIQDLKSLNLLNLKVNIIKWSPKFNEDIIKSDIVIIPTIEDERCLVKSHNRLTESLNLGRFVIANYTPYYNEMKKYCYIGNLFDGLKWLYNNKYEAVKKINRGQRYINNRFAKKVISKKWLDLIKKNLNTRIGV